jgi:membrane-associated phospholipid phosphatase
LLDNAVDSRISSTANADGTYPKSAASNIPYALALGAGLLYTGMGGDSAATTAETSLTAAAYTLGTNLATRYVVGRSRPLDDKGAGDFHGFTSQAVNSGFASNHVALAFALATPFAQQYDMPWLYGAAALTAVGRMQQREHWMSDTVAGAFMGYAIGSLMSEQQQGRKNGVRIMATPQSVAATWSF